MNRLFYLFLFLFVFSFLKISAQNTDVLKQKINQIVSTKKAITGVSIISPNGKETLSINGDRHFPLQSVFKLHIALAVLSQVDQGKFSLDQKIKIEKKDLKTNLYSPIRDKYPNGADLALSEVLNYTVGQSDNVGCDLLLRLLGGPQVVEEYFKKCGIQNISIKINEEVQQANWDLQFENWTTPNAATEVLSKFYYNKPKLLSKNSYDFIWASMKATKTGITRLKGQLPENTVVAHKTGTSGASKEGISEAVNDIGVVFLPNGQKYFISVFVSKSTENSDTNEKIISDISKVTWDYFIKHSK